MLNWSWFLEQAAWVLPTAACVASAVFCLVVLAVVVDRTVARVLGVFAGVVALWSLSVAVKTSPGFVESYPFLLEALNFPLLLLPAAGLQAAVRLSGHQEEGSRIVLRGAWFATALFVLLQFNGLIFSGLNSYPGGKFAGAGPALPAFIAFGVVTVFAGSLATWLGMTKGRTRDTRLASKYWLVGLAAFSPFGALNFLVTYGINWIPVASIGTLLVLSCLAYGIRREGLFGLSRETVRIVEFGLGCATIAALLCGAAGLAMFEDSGRTAWILVGLASLVSLLMLRLYAQPRLLLEALFERLVFTGRASAREAVREFFGNVAHHLRSDAVSRRTAELIVERFGTVGAAVFKKGADGCYECSGGSAGFEIPERIAGEVAMGFVGGGVPPWAALVVGTPPGSADRGFIAVGAKLSGAAFDDSDVTLLTMVAAHVGLAFELADARERLAVQAAELVTLRKKAEDEVAAVRAEVRVNPKFANIVGDSTPLVATLRAVEQAAGADIPVLVTGETGTGKELIARAVHALSRRHDGPMIVVNCPAIPVELAEAELFGHERGAFTGANEARAGRFESAHRGTLFLDEVADLPMGVQIKLLRVLQEQESQRLGSEKIHKLDFRVVAATNRDLHAEVARGRFRKDLLHRLAGVHVVVPPLRDRRADIPALATFFLERAANNLGKDIAGLSAEALECLVDYAWPGNIRELQNVIDRAVLLCPKHVVQAEHLGDLHSDDLTPDFISGNGSLNDVLRDAKIRRVESTLTRTGGNQAAAARILGMSRSNLSRMMKRYGIRANRMPGDSSFELDPTGTNESGD